MTIALGFYCDEGILMCSDSDFSDSTTKVQGNKLYGIYGKNCKTKCTVAFSGNVDLATMFIRKLSHRFDETKKPVFSEVTFLDFLEGELIKFHKKHVFPHPRYGYPDGPLLSLVVAVSYAPNTRPSLIYTNETSVNVSYNMHAATGAGKQMAEYLLTPFRFRYFEKMSRNEILILATHVLYQVKQHVEGCGGHSHFWLLRKDGTPGFVTDWEIPSHEYYSKTFTEILSEVFFLMADMSVEDVKILEALEQVKHRAQIIREEQRAEVEKRKSLSERMNKLRGNEPT